MNTKLALLFVIIAIGYIQCESMDISDSTDSPVNPPYAEKVNATDKEQAEFLSFINSHANKSTEDPAVKQGGIDSYVKWLHFLKSSTPSTGDNVTVQSVIFPSTNIHNVTIQSEIFTFINADNATIIPKTS